jgi:hypothetical protein
MDPLSNIPRPSRRRNLFSFMSSPWTLAIAIVVQIVIWSTFVAIVWHFVAKYW